VWSMIVAEAESAGGMSPAEAAAWLRPTRWLGIDPDGALVIGAPHAMARNRLATRHRDALERAASAILGRPATLRFVVTRDWLTAAPDERSAAG
ncbi:MAG: hypothetical protein ACR2J8_06690, partial [Thermomicrobiales bacterium]